MNKFVSFLFLVTVLGYCTMAGAKTTYFKSEVAGQDLMDPPILIEPKTEVSQSRSQRNLNKSG